MTAARVTIKGTGWSVPQTALYPAGVLRGGAYDPGTNTVYLGGGLGHARGVATAGGNASKPGLAGITVYERADGEVFWANDSQSLRGILTPEQAQAVQQGMEQAYPGRVVRQLQKIADVPFP